MTARQPGSDPTPIDVVTGASARADPPRRAALDSIARGYTDLLGPEHDGPARLSHSGRCKVRRSRQYLGGPWRPITIGSTPACVGSHSRSVERASAALRLVGEQRVLDMACGPGNFTSFSSDKLDGDGFVIGLDNSVPMMERAVADYSHSRAVYMRAEALSLPFDDGVFDAVCCFAALHLVPEPIGVLREMVRVLAPRGRIAVLTSYGRESSWCARTRSSAPRSAVCGSSTAPRSRLSLLPPG